jgi:hypothetical protein
MALGMLLNEAKIAQCQVVMVTVIVCDGVLIWVPATIGQAHEVPRLDGHTIQLNEQAPTELVASNDGPSFRGLTVDVSIDSDHVSLEARNLFGPPGVK